MSLEFLNKEALTTGFGQDLSGITDIDTALEVGGMDWEVEPRPLAYVDKDGNFHHIEGRVENVRTADGKALGEVSGRYKICQNREGFAFLNELLGDGSIELVRGGSFYGGRCVWIEAKIPGNRNILGDPVDEYVIFRNSHDGSGSVRCLVAPIRIVCSNALNLFVKNATRSWSCSHMGDVKEKIITARQALSRENTYMDALTVECERLQALEVTPLQVSDMIEKLLPYGKDPTLQTIRNTDLRREQLKSVYFEKDDLRGLGDTAYRFVNAVSDWATHASPMRRTKNWQENLFDKTVSGNPLTDRAYTLVSNL